MEEQRRQANQTQHARQATNERVAGSQSQRNSTTELPRKRASVVPRIPKKNQRRETSNVPPFFSFSSQVDLLFPYLRTEALTTGGTLAGIRRTHADDTVGTIRATRQQNQSARETTRHL